MKILIISYYYKHKCAMASVRAEKLAKYMSEAGEQVTVLTSMQRDTWTKHYTTPEASDKINEVYAKESRLWGQVRRYLDKRGQRGRARLADSSQKPSAGEGAKKPSLIKRIRAYLSWLFYFKLNKTEDKCLFRGLVGEYKRQGKPRFDTAIATYPSFGAVLFGIWLKRHGYTKKLVLDLRDPIVNREVRTKRAEIRYDIRCQKKALRYADLAVCVSRGLSDEIRAYAEKFGVGCGVITNGFDNEDIENISPYSFGNGKFNFLYTGSMYGGKRSLGMLTSLMRELIDEGKLSDSDICFNYCGNEFDVFSSQLALHSLSHLAKNHGSVPRDTSLSMQMGADALILMTWNSKDSLGVIPGKLYEYISSGTPTLALVCGDTPNSDVAGIIESGGYGYAIEEARFEKEYAKAEIIKIIKGDSIPSASAREYSYSEVAKKYLNLLS